MDMKFHDACTAALVISGRGNQYMEEVAPWTALKKGTDQEKEAAKAALVAVLEAVRVVAVTLKPITPSLSQRIYSQLGIDESGWENLTWEDATWGNGHLTHGASIRKPTPVFVRFEGDMITE
jgi:methionyl-tRNA synthetase